MFTTNSSVITQSGFIFNLSHIYGSKFDIRKREIIYHHGKLQYDSDVYHIVK